MRGYDLVQVERRFTCWISFFEFYREFLYILKIIQRVWLVQPLCVWEIVFEFEDFSLGYILDADETIYRFK